MKTIFLSFFVFIICQGGFLSGLQDLGQRVSAPSSFVQKVERSNIYLFGDALYWHTTETVDWATERTIAPNNEKIVYKTFSFDWSNGFRIGVGGRTSYDQWETGISYTKFTTQARDHASGTVTSAFFGGVESLTGPYQTAYAHLKLHYNVLDATLGRNFEICKALFLHPFIGIKAGRIDQKIHTHWEKPELLFTFFATEKLKNKFRGIGPMGGVQGKWIWKTLRVHSFSLLGDSAGAFMWGHWTLKDKFQDNFFVRVKVISPHSNFGSFVLRGFVGFGWEVFLDNDRSHFVTKVGYEVEDWFNQYQIFDDATGGHNNDLLLQGLTFHLCYDF